MFRHEIWRIRIEKKSDLRDFDCGMVVGASSRPGLSNSKTADLLGFPLTTISRVNLDLSQKQNIFSEQQF